jgi:aspartate racemase
MSPGRSNRSALLDIPRPFGEDARMGGTGKTIGVLGGMGPAATADFYQKIVAATPAKRDQDHPRAVILSDPHIPDRTAAIFGRGPNPTPALITGAQLLVRMGADFIAIPCVTAHHFHPALQAAVSVPVLHIVDETADALAVEHPALRRFGLLATTGTLSVDLFESRFEPRGLTMVTPDPPVQEAAVMPAIYGVKTGESLAAPRRRIREAVDHLVARGAQAIIAGCTEVPLILEPSDLAVPLVDPTWILARAAVRRALGGVDRA